MKRALIGIFGLALAAALFGSGEIPYKGTDIPPRGYAYDPTYYYDILTHTLHVPNLVLPSTTTFPVPNATKWNGYTTPVTGPLYKYTTFFGTFTPTIDISTGGVNVGSFNRLNFVAGTNVTITATPYTSSTTVTITSSGGGTPQDFDLAEATGTLPVLHGGTGSTTAAGARTNLGLVIGTDVEAHDSDLTAVAGISSNGLLAHTGSGTASARTLTSGTTYDVVTNGDGASGNPTVTLSTAVLKNTDINRADKLDGLIGSTVLVSTDVGNSVQGYDSDLGAVAGLSSNGLVARTGTGTAATRTFTSNTTYFTVSNGDGVSGNPTIDVTTSIVKSSDINRLDKLDALIGNTVVPTTTTVNGHALSGNVSVTLGDVGGEASDSDLDAVAALSSNGLIARTGTGTAATRTVVAASTYVTVSNGDGVAGNPSIDVAGLVKTTDLNRLDKLDAIVGATVLPSTWTGSSSITTIGTLASGSVPGSLGTGTFPDSTKWGGQPIPGVTGPLRTDGVHVSTGQTTNADIVSITASKISDHVDLSTQATGILPTASVPGFTGGDVTSSAGSLVLSIPNTSEGWGVQRSTTCYVTSNFTVGTSTPLITGLSTGNLLANTTYYWQAVIFYTGNSTATGGMIYQVTGPTGATTCKWRASGADSSATTFRADQGADAFATFNATALSRVASATFHTHTFNGYFATGANAGPFNLLCASKGPATATIEKGSRMDIWK